VKIKSSFRELDEPSRLKAIETIQKLRTEKKTWEEIYEALETGLSSPDCLRKFFDYHKHSVKIPNSDLIMTKSYDKAYNKLCEMIGKKKRTTVEKRPLGKTVKWLLLSDPHIPLHNEEYIARVIDEHKDADGLIITGDVLDCYAVSRFTKKEDIPLKEEIASAIALFDFLSTKFKEIIILEGNHTDRVRKYFESRIELDMMFLIEYDVLKLITQDYKNVRLVKDSYTFPGGAGEGTICHFTKIGKDCVVGHFETYSKVAMKAGINAYNWANDWSKYFNLGKIRLFIQGHTHALGKVPIRGGDIVVGEAGCVCQVQPYTIEPKPAYQPLVNGYWLIYQTDGITDINRSNFFIN
jgi:predicted phosphodiesterase